MSGPNYAAQAAIKCGEKLFREFLFDCFLKSPQGAPDDPAEALRRLAGVGSRSEFNTDEGAQKWRKVLALFGKWRVGHSKDGDGYARPPFLMGEVAFTRGCDLDDNPFHPEEGPDIDKPHHLWRQGFNVAKWRKAFTETGRSKP